MLHCTLQHCALVRIAEKDQVLTENNLKTAWKCLSIVINIQLEHVMKRVAEMSTGNFSKCANLNMQKCKNENYFILADKTSYITTFSCSDEVESASKQNVLNERDMFVLFILMWTGQNQQNQQNQHHQLLICVKLQFQNFLFPSFLEIQSDWTLSDLFNEAQGHFLISLRQTRYH